MNAGRVYRCLWSAAAVALSVSLGLFPAIRPCPTSDDPANCNCDSASAAVLPLTPEYLAGNKTASPYYRLTNNQVLDWYPVVGDGVVAWLRETGVIPPGRPPIQKVIVMAGGAEREVGELHAYTTWSNVPLQADGTWVMWQDDDSAGSTEKWVYGAGTNTVTQISASTSTDGFCQNFREGRAFWDCAEGLAYFDRTQTRILATADNYQNVKFDGETVTWEEKTGEPWPNDWRIMLFDGTAATCLSALGPAAAMKEHKLGDIDGRRVVWYAKDTSDYELLYYDGSIVTKLTNNTIHDTYPQIEGTQIVWIEYNTRLKWTDGVETVQIMDPYLSTWGWSFSGGKVVWWQWPDWIRVWDPVSRQVRLLDQATGEDNVLAPTIDGYGVYWYVDVYLGAPSYNYKKVIKLWDGTQTVVVRDCGVAPSGFSPRYSSGWVLWTEILPHQYPCLEYYNGQWREVQYFVNDTEVFIRSPDGLVRQLTDANRRARAKLGDLKNGLAVWWSEPMDAVQKCEEIVPGEIFAGGRMANDLVVTPDDIAPANVLEDGKAATINVTVRNSGPFVVSGIKVTCQVDGLPLTDALIASIASNGTGQAVFQWPTVAWNAASRAKKPLPIVVTVDPDDTIPEADETNNQATRNLPGLQKGAKKADADGRGYILAAVDVTPYAVPVALWFDDDAATTPDGLPTRHFNPAAMSDAVLVDIENDFNGTQYPNGKHNLALADFNTASARATVSSWWQSSPGVVIASQSWTAQIAAAPAASYLNWPLLPDTLTGAALRESLVNILNDMGASYLLVYGGTRTEVDAIITAIKNLGLTPGRCLLVKGIACLPAASDESNLAYEDILKAFGDRPQAVTVTNSLVNTGFAATPLAAFYRTLLLDAREIVSAAVSYTSDRFATLDPAINPKVNAIVDGPGGYDIAGLASRCVPWSYIYLVGSTSYLPYSIQREPPALTDSPITDDSDKDWIASDYPYYNAAFGTVPGGRMALQTGDGVDYLARALQFAELPLGQRDIEDGWEDNLLVAGIYNSIGKRNWPDNKVWWLDSLAYQERELSGKAPGMEVTYLFEDATAHKATWPLPADWQKNWYHIDQTYGPVWKAPVFWDTREPVNNPTGSGQRGDGANNDNDKVGCEANDGRYPLERIVDVNNNGVYDAGDIILNEGLTPGIQSTAFVQLVGVTSDEEIWDGVDNDGDGVVDEDCSMWRLMEVEDIYNEALTPADPDIDPGGFQDLISANLHNALRNQGFVLYSGHAWTNAWAIANLGGGKTGDDRTANDKQLTNANIPNMAPSFILASACGSTRTWDGNSIGLEFLRKGALAYLGATAVAYCGASDDFVQMMVTALTSPLEASTIGEAFKTAYKNLGHLNSWAVKFGQTNQYAVKTKYEFILFGLGSVRVDPVYEAPQRVTYGTPVYDSVSKTWSVEVTCDVPPPVEITNSLGAVTAFSLPDDLGKYLADTASHPMLRLIPFRYQLPSGGRLVGVSQVSAPVYKTYDFTLPKLTDSKKYPDPEPQPNPLLTANIDDTQPYTGPLYPDVPFVTESTRDARRNADVVSGSVTAYQVDGTVPRTIVYDTVKLKIIYTAPLGIQETHTVTGNRLNVTATISSTDGSPHTVVPKLTVETVGGIVHKEITGAAVTIGTATSSAVTQSQPRSALGNTQVINLEATEITLSRYIGRITLFENNLPVGDVSFEISPTLRASTAMATSLDSDGVAVVDIKINQITDANTGASAIIPGGIGAYSATASASLTAGIEWVSVRGVAPYLNPTLNTTTGVFGVSSVASPQQPSNSTVAKLVPKLVGDKDTSYTMSVTFTQITPAAGGANVPEQAPCTAVFKRGDANKNGTVDIFDAMFIAQYIVGIRPAADLNVLNAACVKHDTGGDKLDIFDAMFIAQMIVGIRDSRFE
ncbi:MAG: CARDB domain-containing protein [Chloroflexota bacterium]